MSEFRIALCKKCGSSFAMQIGSNGLCKACMPKPRKEREEWNNRKRASRIAAQTREARKRGLIE